MQLLCAMPLNNFTMRFGSITFQAQLRIIGKLEIGYSEFTDYLKNTTSVLFFPVGTQYGSGSLKVTQS